MIDKNEDRIDLYSVRLQLLDLIDEIEKLSDFEKERLIEISKNILGSRFIKLLDELGECF